MAAQGLVQASQRLFVRLVRVLDGHSRPLGEHRLDVAGLHGKLPLAGLPLLPVLLQLPLEIPLHVPENGRLLEVLAAHRVGQLAAGLGHPALQPLELRRQGFS